MRFLRPWPYLVPRGKSRRYNLSKRTLLVDADIVAYQIAAAAERGLDWGDGVFTLHADLNEGKRKVDDYMEGLLGALKGDELIACLTDSTYFRRDFFPDYKMNRAGTRRPMILGQLKAHIMETYRSYLRPSLEGDDCIGILLTHPKIVRGEKIAVSLDKDMKSVPGLHADMKERKVFEVSLEDADYWHMTQTLTGDATDGYPGCPGVGPKNAEKALLPVKGDVPAMWAEVVKLYEKKKLSEEDALVQARVARILRHTDFNIKTKEVIPWSPKN